MSVEIQQQSERMELKSLAEYNREVSKELPKDMFKKDPSRLYWGILFYGAPVLIVLLMMNFQIIWPIKLLLSVMMGTFIGGGAFLAHEVLHGSVTKNKNIQKLVGFLGFSPYLISPTYWKFWHNFLHHGNTQLLYKDPDAFPTRLVWKRSKFMKWAFPFTPGSQYKRSYLYFFWWFSFQAIINQAYMRFNNKMWEKLDHKKVTLEFTLISLAAVGYLALIGPSNWLWLAVIPFFVQNYNVMSYISTNHNISPYTKINDPLLNSLSVTNHSFLEKLHMNFGYHTEHHLFPNAPMAKAKVISEKLKEMYPERYHIMSKKEAIKLLYKTPRIYKNRDVLVNPETGEEFETLSH